MLTAKRLNSSTTRDYFATFVHYSAYTISVVSFLQTIVQPFLVAYFAFIGSYQQMFVSMILTFFFIYLNHIFSSFGGNK